MAARASGAYVTGLRETVRDLERFGVEVEDLKDAFGAISGEIVEEARGRIKVATGAAQATIRPARTKNKAIVRAGTASVVHPAILNYGWPDHNVEADEFLTGPANEDPEDKARKIETNLEALIRRYDLK